MRGGGLMHLLYKMEKTKISLVCTKLSVERNTVESEGCCSWLFFIVFRVISMLSFSYHYFLSSALQVLLWSLSSLNNSGLVIHMLIPSFEVYSNRIYSPTIHKWVSILGTIWLYSPSLGRLHSAASRTVEQFVTDESLVVLSPVNPPEKEQYSNGVWSIL